MKNVMFWSQVDSTFYINRRLRKNRVLLIDETSLSSLYLFAEPENECLSLL